MNDRSNGKVKAGRKKLTRVIRVSVLDKYHFYMYPPLIIPRFSCSTICRMGIRDPRGIFIRELRDGLREYEQRYRIRNPAL